MAYLDIKYEDFYSFRRSKDTTEDPKRKNGAMWNDWGSLNVIDSVTVR